MVLTIREALAVPALAAADPQVVAGSAHLDRAVRWVHVAELPDIAPLLKGGELLLTTGMGLVENPALRRRYLDQLVEAGCAGVVVELGRNFRAMPAEMVETAERLGIPLIALGSQTRFVEVTEQVHRAILSRHYDLLDTVEAMNRRFTTMILGGAGIPQILSALSQTLHNPVILEDAAHQVVGYAPADHDLLDRVLADWNEHSRTGHDEPGPGAVHRCERATHAPACTWVGIWLHHELWGRIHVLEAEHPGDEITTLMLDRAGVALGLAVLSQKDADHLSDRASSAVITDLLAGRFGSGAELLRRARALGSDLSPGGLTALVVQPVPAAGDRPDTYAVAERERLRASMTLRTRLRTVLDEHHCPALVGIDSDRVLAVVAARPARRPHRQLLEDVADALRRSVATYQPGLGVVVGASRQTREDGLQQAFEEARVAAEFGRRSGGADLYEFGSLGTYPLLVQLAQGPELATFVESELGPILQHDAESGAKLLPTLRAYLANAGRKSATVGDLRIQRRTLYARLARLERLLGESVDDQDKRTRLTLALQGLDVLGNRTPGQTT
ncbi:MAG: PucR family transcriptional regulator [Nocardioidaceae bacterium]